MLRIVPILSCTLCLGLQDNRISNSFQMNHAWGLTKVFTQIIATVVMRVNMEKLKGKEREGTLIHHCFLRCILFLIEKQSYQEKQRQRKKKSVV